MVPVLLLFIPLAIGSALYDRDSAAAITFWVSCGLTFFVPFNTFETVAIDTPANFATSLIPLMIKSTSDENIKTMVDYSARNM